jgi:hypothetical protein
MSILKMTTLLGIRQLPSLSLPLSTLSQMQRNPREFLFLTGSISCDVEGATDGRKYDTRGGTCQNQDGGDQDGVSSGWDQGMMQHRTLLSTQLQTGRRSGGTVIRFLFLNSKFYRDLFNVENFIYLYSNSFSTVMVVCTPYVADRHTVLDRQKKDSTDRHIRHEKIFNRQTYATWRNI